ncbi:alpha/beta fold hydrolase [Streptomyces niveus]|uniref:alpha/beta fold hydrolase n=1 Tax=Streptomyces niveus TaxID=193462 RepID=UPI0035DC01A7
MAKIRTGEITTHVQRLPAANPPADGGEPPVVVFVHGLLTDSLASYYFTLGPAFAAAGIDVIMYDLRGHGRSDRPPTGYRLESFVGDLVGVLDALGETRRVHVVGNSFGGTIATAFAAWHPDRVATVTMIESEPPVAEWTRHMADGLTDAKNQLAREEVIGWISANHGAHTARLSRGASRILATTTLAEDVPAGRVIDDGLDALSGCPVLAIFGDESGLSAQVPDLEAKLMSCRTVVLTEQGHSVLVERTEETQELILRWVREHTLAEAVR